jgi:hypothetical protein
MLVGVDTNIFEMKDDKGLKLLLLSPDSCHGPNGQKPKNDNINILDVQLSPDFEYVIKGILMQVMKAAENAMKNEAPKWDQGVFGE